MSWKPRSIRVFIVRSIDIQGFERMGTDASWQESGSIFCQIALECSLG